MKSLKLPLVAALVLCSAAAQAVVVDFSNSTDLADNFRSYPNSSGVSVSQGNNTFVTVTGSTAATSPNILIYDTTPLDTTSYNTFALNVGQTLTLSVNVASITAAQTSLGFFFLNSSQALTASAHSTALMNFDANVSNEERARFGTYQAITSVGTGAGTPEYGAGGISLNDPTFRTVTATYTRNSAQLTTLTLTSGSFTSTFTDNNWASFTNVGVAVRLFPNTGNPANSFQFDEFVTVVPEPSTWALLGLGLGAVLFFRRRKA